MLFILITSLPAQSFLLNFKNIVLELLVLCEPAKLGGKSIMKKEKESKTYINRPRIRTRMRTRMRT